MKNIHLIPTECFNEMPHQIWRKKDGSLWKPTKEFPINSNLNGKVNIYITSDEEISRDTKPCWCLDDKDNSVNYYQGALPLHNYIGYKKIILTTDQDLITDGVQAIDDEFLEWFVKNPSCESVEVKKRYSYFTVDPFVGYKIIIPQEEPKQETLEEAAKNYAEENNDCYTNDYYGFIKGAKWQSERMYSEEYFKLFARQFYREIKLDKSNLLWDELADKCFEQFKKK